jgi:hypothetical protein
MWLIAAVSSCFLHRDCKSARVRLVVPRWRKQLLLISGLSRRQEANNHVELSRPIRRQPADHSMRNVAVRQVCSMESGAAM